MKSFLRGSRREEALNSQGNREILETPETREKDVEQNSSLPIGSGTGVSPVRFREHLAAHARAGRPCHYSFTLFSKVSLLTSAATILFVLLLLPNLLCAQESKTKIRFEAVDIFVDSGAKPLAAYQLEFRVEKGDAKIVGVEGGTHAAFREPPFYDPKAIQKERVILAAFNTSNGNKLPKHKTRVATIHLQISGRKEPEFSVKLKTAANADGEKISAEATFEMKEK